MVERWGFSFLITHLIFFSSFSLSIFLSIQGNWCIFGNPSKQVPKWFNPLFIVLHRNFKSRVSLEKAGSLSSSQHLLSYFANIQSFPQKPFADINRIFFPIHINREHWILVMVQIPEKRIYIFDSLQLVKESIFQVLSFPFLSFPFLSFNFLILASPFIFKY